MTGKEKRAIIILSHGSRNPNVAAQFGELVKNIQNRKSRARIEGAFLQFTEPMVSDVVAAVVNDGYTEIGLVPFFLMHGNHIAGDIPQLISELRKKYPQVNFIIGNILYPDSRLEDILVDRVEGVSV